MPCPYCGAIIEELARGPKPIVEGDISICVNCGELMTVGPYMSLLKCELTSEQLCDRFGLVIYGTLLQVQEEIKLKALARKLLDIYKK